MANELQIIRVVQLANSIKEKAEYFSKKAGKTKELRKSLEYGDTARLYNSFWIRACQLKYTLELGSPFGTPPSWQHLEHTFWKRNQRQKKENGARIFDTKHKYSPWFYQKNFSNDYGTFTCEKCSTTFYHSPSKITLAGKVKYECCCGHCTNDIIMHDWSEKPYR